MHDNEIKLGNIVKFDIAPDYQSDFISARNTLRYTYFYVTKPSNFYEILNFTIIFVILQKPN